MRNLASSFSSLCKNAFNKVIPSKSNLIEQTIQITSAFFEGVGWTFGAFAAGSISLKTTWPWYLGKSFSTGLSSCILGCGTNHILKCFKSKSSHETRWDSISGIFLNNACWQGIYDLLSLFIKQELLFMFAPVGGASAAAYSLPLIFKYLIAYCHLPKEEFQVLKREHELDDIKSLFITFLSCGAFVVTNIPANNFFYTETGYDSLAENTQVLYDMARSGMVTSLGYIGSALMISLISQIKTALTNSSASEYNPLLQNSTDSVSSLA